MCNWRAMPTSPGIRWRRRIISSMPSIISVLFQRRRRRCKPNSWPSRPLISPSRQHNKPSRPNSRQRKARIARMVVRDRPNPGMMQKRLWLKQNKSCQRVVIRPTPNRQVKRVLHPRVGTKRPHRARHGGPVVVRALRTSRKLKTNPLLQPDLTLLAHRSPRQGSYPLL